MMSSENETARRSDPPGGRSKDELDTGSLSRGPAKSNPAGLEADTLDVFGDVRLLGLAAEAARAAGKDPPGFMARLGPEIRRVFAKVVEIEGRWKNRKPRGRPHNTDDDWAWIEINVKGRKQADVFKEWLGKAGPRAEFSPDPRDMFKKAIARRRGGRNSS